MESKLGSSDAVPWMPGIIEEDAPASGAPAPDPDTPQPGDYERGHRDGLMEGHADGLAEGRRLERETLLPLRVTLDAVLSEIAERQNEWETNLDENLAALAVAIARQLIGREMEDHGAAVVELVRRALARFPVGHAVTIRLNPEDLTVLSAEGSSTGRPDSRWIADPLIERGGCVVEGPDSVIDGRLDRALERVYRSLTGD